MTAPASGSTPRVVLHIGLLGSGGAHLRSALQRNADALAAAGVRTIVPDDRAVAQALTPDGAPDLGTGWSDLVAAVAAGLEPVRVVTADRLSTASDGEAEAIASWFAPAPVEVVLTVMDTARTIPRAWQLAVESGRKLTFADFAAAATGSANDRPTREQLASQHDVVGIVRRWSQVVGPARVHLVTVPPAGAAPGLLWTRFASVLGVELDLPELPDATDGALCFSETELLRRVNRRVASEFGEANYERYIRDFFAREVLGSLSPTDPSDRPALDAKGLRWAARRGRQIATELAELAGVDVVGDLEDLVPDTGATTGQLEPSSVYPDAAVRAVAMLMRKLIEVDPASAPKPPKSSQPARKGLRGAGRRAMRAGS